MKDPLFGPLTWSDSYWEGKVSLPYFRGFGAGMAPTAQDPTEPPDPFSDDDDDDASDDAPTICTGRLNLIITPIAGERRKPTDAQRLAWKTLLDRRDAAWDELMQRLLDEYRRQRPLRARWHQSVFGDHALARVLPDFKDPRALSKLIHPTSVLIQPHAVAPAATPDVLVQFAGGWLANGFAVVLRDGRVAGFGRYDTPDTDEYADARFDHPVFGRLHWNIHYHAWFNDVAWNAPGRLDGLETFAPVAAMRANFQSNRAHFKHPELPLDWEFVNGRLSTAIHPIDVEPPTARQAAACESFRASAKDLAAQIAEAIFKQFKSAGGSTPVRNADAMREHLELSTIHVFPDDPKDARPPAVGITFYGPDDQSFGVLLRDGRLESVGDTDTAEPPPRKRSGKRPAAPNPRIAMRGLSPAPKLEAPLDAAPPAPAPPVAPTKRKPRPTTKTKTAPKPKAPVTYTTKPAKAGDNVGIDLDLISAHLDPALHPHGKLRIVLHEDNSRRDRALTAFENATILHYLRQQSPVRAQLDEALAADQEDRWPEGDPVRGDVWNWARLLRLEFNPPRPRRKHPPKSAFTLYFDCDWEEEHQVVVEFEDDTLKSVYTE